MMKLSVQWHRILWILFVLAIPGIIIYSFYSKVFACPECYLFQDTGDGLKNYYTLAWYVVHDQGWHFSGMNYPYGDHIIYTDNQPVLAMTLRWIHHHLFPMNRHVIGTMNMLLLISLYLGVLFTYKLFRRWSVGRWWALGSALCIIFLSPQIMRFHGHYGLGYVCFFPLLFLLLDYIVRGPGKRWMWSLFTGLLVIIMSLTHMYFLFLTVLAILSFLIFWAWYNRKNKSQVRSIAFHLTGVILIPAFLLMGIKKYTDPVTDRPTEPWGIDHHSLDLKTTFFNFGHPFDYAWTIFFEIERPIIEKIAYTGFIGLLLLPVVIIFLFQKNKDEPVSTVVKTFTGTAVILWLMGAGVFYQTGFKFLWDWIPVLKQFRGLGRFGLPFYYLYTMVCSYLLWNFLQRMREREMSKAGGYILFMVFLVWGFEAFLNLKEQSAPIYRHNKALSHKKESYTPLLTAAGKKPEDFQCILQFPLVAIGNENMGIVRGFWSMREGMRVSWETGLPLIDYVMSRTSISQGLDFVELISTPYTPKRRAQLLNEKPILIVSEEEFVIPAERKWIEKAEKIGTYETITLYSLPSQAFKEIHIPGTVSSNKDQPCGWFLDFEENSCDTAMTGNGALPIITAPQSIWSFTDTSNVERLWIVSFWSHVDSVFGAVPVPRMMEKGPDGNVLRNTGLHRDNIPWSEAYGEWIEIEFPWNTLGKGYSYELFIDNTGPVIDNLLIRPVNDTCVYHFPGMILYNNLPILNAQ